MLKGRRTHLIGALKDLQDDLDFRQRQVDSGEAGENAWQVFINLENKRTKEGKRRLSEVLRDGFHGKCAYCESVPMSAIDHYWPKAPGPANQRLGTSAKMFCWSNMLPSCSACNGPAWKSTKLELGLDGRPLLLEPTLDDPFCYLEIVLAGGIADLTLGWIDARAGLSGGADRRARHTIQTLGLNLREDVRRGRARTISHFAAWYHMLQKFGPDFECPPPERIRDKLCQLLDPREPYLAPIRQLLLEAPGLHEDLVRQVPELGPLIDQWHLPPDDCAPLRRTPAAHEVME